MKRIHFDVVPDVFYGSYSECKKTRVDIDKRMTAAIENWKGAKR